MTYALMFVIVCSFCLLPSPDVRFAEVLPLCRGCARVCFGGVGAFQRQMMGGAPRGKSLAFPFLFRIKALLGTPRNLGLLRDYFELGPFQELVRIRALSGTISNYGIITNYWRLGSH